MKQILILGILIFFIDSAKGQKIDSDTICIKDTVLVKGIWTYPQDFILPDTTNSFFATYCDYRKNFGLRFDFGFSQYVYSKSTANWIGYHQGTNLVIDFVYKKLNLGFRFKPWTTNPKSELSFDDKLLTKEADINPFKFDYYISYEIDLNQKYSIESSIGFTECKFKVINEDKIGEYFNFKSTNGLLTGLTINKYIPFDNYKYFVLFYRMNYGFVDYSDIHSELAGGYFESCIGISYKFYRRDRLYNIIEK